MRRKKRWGEYFMKAGLGLVPGKGRDFWRSLAWQLVVRSSQHRARKNTSVHLLSKNWAGEARGSEAKPGWCVLR